MNHDVGVITETSLGIGAPLVAIKGPLIEIKDAGTTKKGAGVTYKEGKTAIKDSLIVIKESLIVRRRRAENAVLCRFRCCWWIVRLLVVQNVF
jgi:hypothetical protein